MAFRFSRAFPFFETVATAGQNLALFAALGWAYCIFSPYFIVPFPDTAFLYNPYHPPIDSGRKLAACGNVVLLAGS